MLPVSVAQVQIYTSRPPARTSIGNRFSESISWWYSYLLLVSRLVTKCTCRVSRWHLTHIEDALFLLVWVSHELSLHSVTVLVWTHQEGLALCKEQVPQLCSLLLLFCWCVFSFVCVFVVVVLLLFVCLLFWGRGVRGRQFQEVEGCLHRDILSS